MALPEVCSYASAKRGGEALSSENKAELERQRNLFGRSAFVYLNEEPDFGKRTERLAVVATLKQLACDIRMGKKTINDFFAYQDELMKNPANTFLEESYPGLNMAGWRVVMALIDPLAYGRLIEHAAG